MIIRRLHAFDLRFPTSDFLHGSDAMHTAPDYSAAYVILETDTDLEGHGLAFTVGRGNEVVVAAIRALEPLVRGWNFESFMERPVELWRALTNDSQLRWIGPDKGALHLGAAAVVNALWDLYAKRAGKPLWKLLADMSPEQLVACVDFRYLTDALTPEQALDLLRKQVPTRRAREEQLAREGYPAYTTSTGWLGYSDDQLATLARQATAEGWTHFKLKIGRNLEDDRRRCRLLRDVVGPDARLMLDANQVWDVPQAIAWIRQLTEFRPYWIEEPTHPDDVLGHLAIATAVAPMPLATGEHCANRIVFKQLLQTRAIGFCQLDPCRLAGINEALAVLLLAARFGAPVCPHAGGVGLCEIVQHLSMFDYIAVSACLEHRVIEYVDHLHEHFVHPVRLRRARYQVPTAPGANLEIRAESRVRFEFPTGAAWASKRIPR